MCVWGGGGVHLHHGDEEEGGEGMKREENLIIRRPVVIPNQCLAGDFLSVGADLGCTLFCVGPRRPHIVLNILHRWSLV